MHRMAPTTHEKTSVSSTWNAMLREVYRNWILDKNNVEYLPMEQQGYADIRAAEDRCKDFWPKEIRDLIKSGRPMVDNDGHFFVPNKWLWHNDHYYKLMEARCQFARKSAPQDPNILPYEEKLDVSRAFPIFQICANPFNYLY
jgi:hypothetical protein